MGLRTEVGIRVRMRVVVGVGQRVGKELDMVGGVGVVKGVTKLYLSGLEPLKFSVACNICTWHRSCNLTPCGILCYSRTLKFQKNLVANLSSC